MAIMIRDKVSENVQSMLEPGEQIQAVIPAQTKSGWLGAIGSLWLLLVNRYHPVVVTNKRILVTDSGRWTMGNPKSIVATLPRSTQIGPPHGLWWKCESFGDTLYVDKRFHGDVEKADAARTS